MARRRNSDYFDINDDVDNVNLASWANLGGDVFQPIHGFEQKLPAGVYEIRTSQTGPKFALSNTLNDSLIEFDGSVGKSLVEEVRRFWSLDSRFRENGFLHRRGYILHGPPGTGKTCLLAQIIKNVIADKGIAIMVKDVRIVSEGLKLLRIVEPTRPVVCLLEDIDELLGYSEHELLAFLDGEDNIEHVVNLATTNHLEDLPDRIKARPRRFDRIVKIPAPTDMMRRKFLTEKFKFTDDPSGREKLEQLVMMTDRLTFAQLSDIAISVMCLDKPIEESVRSMRQMAGEQEF